MDYYELYKSYKRRYKNIKKNSNKQVGGKKTHGEIFSKIYASRIWAPKKNTPLSGAGSTKSYNKLYIDFLQNFIHDKDNKIKTIVDLGCGDWSFTQSINFNGKKYMGIDCVENVIKQNKKKYQKENIKFKVDDFSKTTNLSKYLNYDLLIMKDVLQHWSDEEIIKVLDYLTTSKIKPRYILITHGKRKQEDSSKKRSVDNYHHYSNLNFKIPPLKKYKIKHLFDYKFKEVGIIDNTT